MWQLHWAIFMRGTKRMHLQQRKYMCGSVYLLAVCHTTEPPEPQSVTLSAMGLTEWQWAGSPGDLSIISYIFYHQASGTQDDQHLNEGRNVNTGNDLRVEIDSLSPYTTYTYCVVVIYHRCQSVLQKLLWKQLVCSLRSEVIPMMFCCHAAPGDQPQSLLIDISSLFAILVTCYIPSTESQRGDHPLHDIIYWHDSSPERH